MAKKFDVYKDNEGDYTIIPHGAELKAPVVVAAVSGDIGDLREVDKLLNKDPRSFVDNQTNVTEQDVVDMFGPFTYIGDVTVQVL